jgi:hypothetical protein
LISKAFSNGPPEENLELLLNQKIEYRREVFFNEMKRNHIETLVFEVFPDEIY